MNKPLLCSGYNRGFTLIELIVVIIILGVLSVVVATRFQGKSGFAEFAWQKRVVSALRNVQLRAMQDTRSEDGLCHQLNISVANNQFGLPPVDDSCSQNIDFDRSSFSASGPTSMTDDQVAIALTDNSGGAIGSIGFNGLGQPIDETRNRICVNGCVITLTDSLTTRVCVESEGFIHACI